MLNTSGLKKQLENLVHDSENHLYLLAVSGGADSMVLAHCFKELNIKFQIAHINYNLRGEDSVLDQEVVQDFCNKHHIVFHGYEVSEKDEKPEHSIQLWARELRYAFFKQIQERENIEYLVTAHHLNDQLETFIIHLSKASGINGLSGIPANENNILRPLLSFSKEEIYRFAKENSIEYREDYSNQKNDYLRNKIRNEVVPKLLETNDHFLENFRKSSSYLNQTKDFVRQQVLEIENRITLFNPYHKILSKEQLAKESSFVQFEVLKKYGFDQEEEIAKIFNAENGSTFSSKEYRLTVDYDTLVLIRKTDDEKRTENQEIILIEKSDLSENQMAINLENIMEIEEIDKSFEWDFDARKVLFPLRLRRAQEGDEFYPAGFSGKKKVSKFFRDEKISILARQKIWLLSDSENSVLGIIPFRQDRRNSKDENTEKILKIFNKKNNEI